MPRSGCWYRHNRVEGQLGSCANQRLKFGRGSNTWHLNENASLALPLNCRLTGADFVDAAANDFKRLLNGAFIGGNLFCLGHLHDDKVALGPGLDVAGPNSG